VTELLTASQMRAIEMAAIENGAVTGLELMERAGQGVVDAVFIEWPALSHDSHGAVILCGPGNNGGDGFVVARLLHDLGWQVEVFVYGDIDKISGDARVNLERCQEIEALVPKPLTAFLERKSWKCDLILDALFGIGLTRALPELGELFWNFEDMVDCFDVEFGHEIGRPAIVAVDIPSGVCADSGRAFPTGKDWEFPTAWAHLTVTFHRPKQGHFLNVGAEACGKLVTVDIGLNEIHRTALIEHHGCEPTGQGLGRYLCWKVDAPHDLQKTGAHKYDHGHVLVLSGGVGKGGAARLAARGALRVGAGLVTLGCPPAALQENAARLDAVMLRAVRDEDALSEVLADERINAICLGPGLGISERTKKLVEVVLATKRCCVLDADALTVFKDTPEQLFEQLHNKCVLTPHGGEFARLFPDVQAKLDEPAVLGPAYSKIDAVREASARAGSTVLLKGADTVIANAKGHVRLHSAHYERSVPWLATAGAGDVLAGIIAGLLARGYSPNRAAEIAAWLLTESALNFGPGLIAEDLPEGLPAVFRKLEL